MAPQKLLDAQSALSFATAQASFIEREVYKIQYPDIQYPSLIPVDTSAPEWVKSVTYFSMDSAGQSKWINGAARDIPLAELNRAKFETGVEMAAIGYGWDLEEISQAALIGMNLGADKAEAARRAAEEQLEQIALSGDASKGFEGLFNHSAVSHAAAADGASTTSDWPSKTAAEILFDINDVLSDIVSDSKTVEIADTLLLPWDRYFLISTKMLSSSLDSSVLDYVREKNVYTAKTKRELDIRGVLGLETAGAGGLDSAMRMVAYRKDPSVLKMHMPMPFRFLPVWQDGPMHYVVPGIFRTGGVDIRRPGAVRYRDGI